MWHFPTLSIHNHANFADSCSYYDSFSKLILIPFFAAVLEIFFPNSYSYYFLQLFWRSFFQTHTHTIFLQLFWRRNFWCGSCRGDESTGLIISTAPFPILSIVIVARSMIDKSKSRLHYVRIMLNDANMEPYGRHIKNELHPMDLRLFWKLIASPKKYFYLAKRTLELSKICNIDFWTWVSPTRPSNKKNCTFGKW